MLPTGTIVLAGGSGKLFRGIPPAVEYNNIIWRVCWEIYQTRLRQAPALPPPFLGPALPVPLAWWWFCALRLVLIRLWIKSLGFVLLSFSAVEVCCKSQTSFWEGEPKFRRPAPKICSCKTGLYVLLYNHSKGGNT